MPLGVAAAEAGPTDLGFPPDPDLSHLTSQPPAAETDPALADVDPDAELDEVTGTPIIHVGE